MLEFSKESLNNFDTKVSLIHASYPNWNTHAAYLYSLLRDPLYLEEIKVVLQNLNWEAVYCKHYPENQQQELVVQLKPDSAVPAEIYLQRNIITYQLEKHANVHYQINYNGELNQLFYKLPELTAAFNQHCSFLFS